MRISFLIVVLFFFLGNTTVFAQVETDLGVSYFEKAKNFQKNEQKLDSAAYYFSKAAKIFHPDNFIDEKDPEYLAKIFQNYLLCNNELADVYNIQGKNNEAIEILVNNLVFAAQKLGGEQNLASANSYNNLGVAYDGKGEYQKALNNYKRAEKILLELGGDDKQLSLVQNNIGAIYEIKEDYENAQVNYQKSLEAKQKVFEDTSIFLANAYNNIANVYTKQEKYDKAAEYYKKGFAISKNATGLDQARFCLNAGSLAERREKPDFSKALADKRSALKFFMDELGEKGMEVGKTYAGIALTFLKRGETTLTPADFDSCLHYTQKALCALVDNFNESSYNANPSVSNVIFEKELLSALELKAKAFYRKKTRANWSQTSIVADSALKLIHNKRLTVDNDKDKEFWSEKFFQCSQLAIDAAWKMGDLETAFAFSEQSKAGILLQAMTQVRLRNEMRADSLSQAVGDKSAFSMIDKIAKIKIKISDFKKKIAQEEAKGRKKQKNKIKEWQTEQDKAEKEYESVRRVLEKQKPEYAKPKYEAGKINPDTVKKFLKYGDSQKGLRETAVLEYFMGDSALFVFCITSESFFAKRVPYLPDSITAAMRKEGAIGKKLEDSIQVRHDAFQNSIREMRKSINVKEHKLYAQSAYALAKELLKPIWKILLRDSIHHLIIIPDGPLCYVPFEALLTENAEEKREISDFPFLAKRFDVYYSFSAGLLRLHRSDKPRASKDFVAFAPIFGIKKRLSSNFASVNPLPKSEQEVLQIAELFKSLRPNAQVQLFTNLFASEEKTEDGTLNEYKIVHFATHGLVYPNNPENSGILLYQDANETTDGLLDCAEIMGIDLRKTELVVLSACETGLGQMVRGEGLVGLTRAFLQAGATNVVVSLWPVSDASTAELMIQFYTHILKGGTLSEALQKAKKQMISSQKFAAPYYWAPFIISGRADLRAE